MPEPLGDRLAHPCFPQPAKRTAPVWRYMALPKLVALLQTRRLFFARLDRSSWAECNRGSDVPRGRHVRESVRRRLVRRCGTSSRREIRAHPFRPCYLVEDEERSALLTSVQAAAAALSEIEPGSEDDRSRFDRRLRDSW